MAIVATTQVPTPDYWKFASDLQVGDWVFNKDGKLTQIKLIHDYRAEKCYEVHLHDGIVVQGDQNLAFKTENKVNRNNQLKYRGVKKLNCTLKRKDIKTLLFEPLVSSEARSTISIPTARPLCYPHQDLPVPPFVFAFWYFSRQSKQRLSLAYQYEDEVTEKFRDLGYKIIPGTKRTENLRMVKVLPNIESQLIPNIPKQIPNNYLMGSPEQRIEFLRGIVYAKSRSYNEKHDVFRFSSKHLPMVLRVQGLIESLGIRTYMRENPYRKTWTVFFRTKIQLIPNQRPRPMKVYESRRFIKKIIEIPAQQCVHIETTDPDNSILVGEGYIATC